MKLLAGFALACIPWQSSQGQDYPDPASPKDNSVLAAGPTLKVAVTENNVYRISFENLQNQGLVNQSVPSSQIALFGNKAGMLPVLNLPGTYDDLSPLPIRMEDGGDGSFDPGDYFLFLGESPHVWTYDAANGFLHQTNYYSDTTFYFVSANASFEHRIQTLQSPASASLQIDRSMEHVHHENDLSNLCSGSVHWLGESFTYSGQSRTITLATPDPVAGTEASLFVQTSVQTNTGTASFSVSAGGQSFQLSHSSRTGQDHSAPCSDFESTTQSISIPGSQTPIVFDFQKNSAASNGYLDQISLVYTRSLNFQNGALFFRNPEAIGNTARFNIQSSASIVVWDISDVYHIRQAVLSQSGNTRSFTAPADTTLHEYVAFNPASCPAPIIKGRVEAQNLHANANIEYIVVAHPAFASQAEEVARMHQERDGYSVLVATTEQVYNEFSSGAKDPSAIRMLAKRIWEKSDSLHRPRYLLLFGAASYDYKGRLGSVSDYVPTFQAYFNLNEGGGDPVEDNFAFMEENEGYELGSLYGGTSSYSKHGDIDIAVGRLPVRSTADADIVTEKIDIYSSPGYLSDARNPNLPGNFGDWRNELVFVTDDGYEDGMEGRILTNDWPATRNPAFHVNKLYSDAYERTTSATSTRAIGLENDIRTAIEEGSFFIGYYGHSGWDAWSDERILSTDIINQLSQSYSFPIMMSSSCTFGYFDYVNRTSAAELLMLREHGGSIATITTSRTAYTSSIETIHRLFVQQAIDKTGGHMPTIGDAFLYAKRNHSGDPQRFVLLGDPGLKTALPRYEVKTLRVNGTDVTTMADTSIFDEPYPGLDTLKALFPVTIEGCVTDHEGNIVEDFNGTLVTKVYDKTVTESTLGLYNSRNGRYNTAISYNVQNSILFQGYSEVKDGRFSLSFIVPKDIQYNYGNGKISYYAYSDNTDANGSFDGIVVGGFNPEAVLDTNPPVVDLYINRDNYIPGTVGDSPYLYAEISDNFGINTTGTGIGHDMTLIIDEDASNPIVVNNQFRYNSGSYTEGTLSYPLSGLSEGRHTAQLKVWNINNISTTETIEFLIGKTDEARIFEIRAIPNPVRGDYVDIYFNHNGYGGGIERCEINIFSMQGARMASFDYPVDDISGYSIGPIRWEIGRSSVGRVQSGMYICHVRAHHVDGEISHKTVKIVVIR